MSTATAPSKLTAFNLVNSLARNDTSGFIAYQNLDEALEDIKYIRNVGDLRDLNKATRADDVNVQEFLGFEASRLLDVYKKYESENVKNMAFEAFRVVLDLMSIPRLLPIERKLNICTDVLCPDTNTSLTRCVNVYLSVNNQEGRNIAANAIKSILDEAPIRPKSRHNFGVTEPCGPKPRA